MKIKYALVLYCLFQFHLLYSKSKPVIDTLFYGSYEVYDHMRYANGVYSAKLSLTGGANTYSAISVTGMGLISLCIADSMHWINNGKTLALQTIKTMMGYTPGFSPKRNPAGFFPQYIDPVTGAAIGKAQYSTIDNAVLVAGVLFCKKYFNDDSITAYANTLWNGYNWVNTIASADSSKIYLTLDSMGNGTTGSVTRMYDEYVLVAWLAKNQECLANVSGPATRLWNKFLENPDSIPNKPVYSSVQMIGVFKNTYQPEHVMGMPHFLCHYHSVNARYAYYMRNMEIADSLWWATTKLTKPYERGMSAGSGISSGYEVDAINNNVDTIVSPHALASFIPVDTTIRSALVRLYNNNKGVYPLPFDSTYKILWRYSALHTTWKATVLQGVDFAPFLFGIASLPEYMGFSFFQRNNDFFSPKASFIVSKTPVCAGGCIDFTDSSINGATSWMWSFKGSAIDSSSVENPKNVCYAQPGTYQVTLIAGNGCGSSTYTKNITVNTVPATPVISIAGTNVLSSSSGNTYQWYLDTTKIAGAINQTDTATQSGNYSVCITNAAGCSSCSAPYHLTVTSIYEHTFHNGITISPNPGKGLFNIYLNGPSGNIKVEVYDITGRILYNNGIYLKSGFNQSALNLSSFDNGIYFIHFIAFTRQVVQKIMIVH